MIVASVTSRFRACRKRVWIHFRTATVDPRRRTYGIELWESHRGGVDKGGTPTGDQRLSFAVAYRH